MSHVPCVMDMEPQGLRHQMDSMYAPNDFVRMSIERAEAYDRTDLRTSTEIEKSNWDAANSVS